MAVPEWGRGGTRAVWPSREEGVRAAPMSRPIPL